MSMSFIRPMVEQDLKEVLEIENVSFVSHWKKEDLLHELNENSFANVNVIENDGRVVGFYDYWHTFDSATICQIAVHPNFRNKKIGSMLMEDLINECCAKRVSIITLEVRKSNRIAIDFYLKHGFIVELTKEKYYSNGEDALYMTRRVN